MALYTIRSERQFCERLQYDLLFKWFLDLNIMDPAFDSPPFPRTRLGYWTMRCLDNSSKRCWPKLSAGICCPMSTSPWMGPCWNLGRH